MRCWVPVPLSVSTTLTVGTDRSVAIRDVVSNVWILSVSMVNNSHRPAILPVQETVMILMSRKNSILGSSEPEKC